jgi:RNA polymerase sigma-70 factor, ECF subfamily
MRDKRGKTAEMSKKKENDILRLLQSDPEEGMKQLIELYGGAVMTICRNILFDCASEDIEEAAADSLVGLWRSAGNYQGDQGYSLKSYLYGVPRHTALDKRRKLKKQESVLPIDELLLEAADNVEFDYLQKIDSNIVHDSLSGMDEPDRSIFILRYFYFEKVKDIAERLKLAPKHVENRLYYGKNKLRQAFEERGYENAR